MTHRALPILCLMFAVHCRATEKNAELKDDTDSITPHQTSVTKEFSIDLKEISGACLKENRNSPQLIVVGDRDFEVVFLTFDRQFNRILNSQRVNLDHMPAIVGDKQSSQWEAIACDNTNRLFLLDEEPGAIHIVDSVSQALVGTVKLKFDNRTPPGWKQEKNHRGEGLVLLRNGHILIVKEQKPSLIVEFGPADDLPEGLNEDLLMQPGEPFPAITGTHEYKALFWWRFNTQAKREMRDFSDITVGPDGRIYLLSDESRMFGRLEGRLKVADNVDSAELADIKDSGFYKLSSRIDKPEAIVITPDFIPLVLSDQASTEDSNLFKLDPIAD